MFGLIYSQVWIEEQKPSSMNVNKKPDSSLPPVKVITIPRVCQLAGRNWCKRATGVQLVQLANTVRKVSVMGLTSE